MSDISVIMTKDEIVDSYHWNLVKRIMLNEFPWITDISVEEPNLNKYNLIFAEIYIDPFKFARTYNTTIPRYTIYQVLDNIKKASPFISTYFDITYEEGKEIQEEMDKVLRSVEKSQALPDELKLPNSRPIVTGDFILAPNLQIPEEYKSKIPY